MRARPFTLAFIALAFLADTSGAMANACSGEACGALVISPDGCLWKNASERAVRFSLVAGQVAIVTTVLGPGESFKQSNRDQCVTAKDGAAALQAAFVTLRQMPPEDPPPPPRTKPAASAVTTAAAMMVASMRPVPRPKPALATLKPTPRIKPAEFAGPPPEEKTQTPAITTAATLPIQADPAHPCGDACAEILFKMVDDCIWVQSQNPKPILFQATIDGHMVVLALEGADAAKADKGKPSTAYHARQPDPFQSSSSGIPVFRARLDEAKACVKDRNLITHFVAQYRK